MIVVVVSPIVDAVPGPVPAVQSFPGSTQAQWDALKLSGLGTDGNFQPNLGCFLVRWEGLNILCDAGIGAGPNHYLEGLEGNLLERLELAPEEIDLVIFTHLHMDHVGWATRDEGAGTRNATFLNARYVVATQEYSFWAGRPPEARPHHLEAFETAFRPLETMGCLETVAYGEDIVPGVSLLSVPGHTPGHAAIVFAGENEVFAVVGDVFHCPGQIERPAFSHRADMAPETARRSRITFIERCASENWLIGAGHFRDGLQVGKIVAEGEGFVFSPR